MTSLNEARIQMLTTGNLCEERGCKEQARWFLSAPEGAFHWCPMHTITYMDEPERWTTDRRLVQPVSK